MRSLLVRWTEPLPGISDANGTANSQQLDFGVQWDFRSCHIICFGGAAHIFHLAADRPLPPFVCIFNSFMLLCLHLVYGISRKCHFDSVRWLTERSHIISKWRRKGNTRKRKTDRVGRGIFRWINLFKRIRMYKFQVKWRFDVRTE